MHFKIQLYKQFLLFLLAIASFNQYAQVLRGVPNDQSINNLIVKQWKTEQGLVTNKIIKVKQSLDGYLWLATYDGILRFDGVSFDLYNSANTEEIRQDTYYDIVEGQDSTLWFFSRGDGLLTYKNGKFSRFDSEELPKSMRSLFIDSKHRLWIAGFEKVLFLENGEITILNHETINDGEAITIIEDDDGVMYFGTNGSGVVTYDGKKFTKYTKENSGLKDDIIISLHKTVENEIIAGTFFGISILSNGSVRNIPFVEDTRINDILYDENDNILLGTDRGLFRINESLGIYEKLIEGNKLPTREINSIEIDHEGNIWLAMERGGLLQLKSGKISNYTVEDGLSLDRVNVIRQRNDVEFWVGSDNGDVDIINMDNNTITPLSINIASDRNGIRDILFDKGTTWIASYDGLLKIQNGKAMKITEENGLSSRLVRRLMKDSKGNIWVATRSGGVNKISPDGTIEIFDKSRGLKSNYILTVLENKGKIYLGTNRGGISIIDSEGRVATYENMKDEFSDAVYFNIRADTKGRVWIVSSSGLFQFKDENYFKIEIDSELGTKSYFDIIDDGNGSYWLTTSKGLVQIDVSDIDLFLKGELEKVGYRLYNDSDGLPSSECTAATLSIIDSKGKLWIPTNGGVGVLDPSTLESNPMFAPTYIKYFRVDDYVYPTQNDTRITIKPGKLRYSIGFTALSYIAPENIQFKYKMKGLDKEWTFINGQQREIEYTNIDPGTYTFEVYATNNDGLWNSQSGSLTFIVEPYIYQTIWFYVVLIILIVLLFLIAARWRIARVNKRNIELQKLNSELDSFVYSTSHDLRAPLASMLGLLNIAKLDEDLSQKNAYMDLMELSIKKLDGFIQDIIDYSRNTRLDVVMDSFNIEQLADEILEELKYMDSEELIEKNVIIEGDEIVHGDYQRVKIILNNIISNALKYYDVNEKKCRINILIQNTGQQLLICIEDNGIGIEKDQIKNVFNMFYRATEKSKGSGIGLYIVKETIAKLGGTIQVNSEYSIGTTFKIVIPNS